MSAEGKASRERRRLISDTNYYQWRGRGTKLGIPPELFDQLWTEAAALGPAGVEALKDEVRQQERERHGI